MTSTTPTEPEALAACPFCGATDEGFHLQAIQSHDLAGNPKDWMVECDECAGYGPSKPTKAEAIAAWNRRTPAARMLAGEGDEHDKLIAAGFDDYAARCALRTEDDGGFCHAYYYSDGQWRFQTGGNDITVPSGDVLHCVLTKRLYAHPPAAEPVGLREALQLAHDTLHECTAVLTASDCAKVSAAMAVCRKALATPARTDDAGVGGE